MKMKWSGVWAATITPFKNGKIDTAVLAKLIQKYLDAGIQGFCPAGTTGEGATLNDDEFASVVETVLKVAQKKVPVVPGTGSNDTLKTIERTKLAKKLGASGALVVTPYYVKPTPAGLVRHYSEISKATDLPIMLYNVPGRTGVNILPKTVDEVVRNSNVVAIKDCSPLTQVSYLVRLLGEKISIFSGEDPTFLPFLSLGGDGIVSVAANVIPEAMLSIFKKKKKGNLEESRKEFLRFVPLFDALFCESNPIPLKTALEWLKCSSAEVRSPLAPISKENGALLKDEMMKAGLL